MSRDRALLHKNKIDEFVIWAKSQGFKQEPTKGAFEVLRLRKGGNSPIIFHVKVGAIEHVTCWGQGVGLVKRFIASQRQ